MENANGQQIQRLKNTGYHPKSQFLEIFLDFLELGALLFRFVSAIAYRSGELSEG